MYDELIKRLRAFCKGCKLWDGCKCCLKGECSQQKSLQAADTIEELQKDLERSKDFEAFWQHEAEEALKKFQVAISNKPRWIPITERLPEYMENVLVTDGVFSGMGWRDYYDYHGTKPREDYWISPNSNVNDLGITHWMPLPQPPKNEGE